MSRLYLRSPIPPFHTADGAAYNTSVTLTDVSAAPQIVPSAAVMLEPGMEIEVNAYGEFTGTGTPTLLMGLYWGGVAGVALAASTAVTMTTTAAAWPWQLYYRGRIRSIGTTGSIKGMGTWSFGTSLTALTVRPIPETAAARTVTIDTTAGSAKALTIGAQWGTSAAGNTLTAYDLSIDIAN